jgi:hypothetical protein
VLLFLVSQGNIDKPSIWTILINNSFLQPTCLGSALPFFMVDS